MKFDLTDNFNRNEQRGLKIENLLKLTMSKPGPLLGSLFVADMLGVGRRFWKPLLLNRED